MSSKNKLSKQQKYLRRLNELKKAAARVDTRLSQNNSQSKTDGINERTIPTGVISEKYQLPVTQIKKDVGKNFLFALFSVILVVVLKVTGFGFDQIKHLLNL